VTGPRSGGQCLARWTARACTWTRSGQGEKFTTARRRHETPGLSPAELAALGVRLCRPVAGVACACSPRPRGAANRTSGTSAGLGGLAAVVVPRGLRYWPPPPRAGGRTACHDGAGRSGATPTGSAASRQQLLPLGRGRPAPPLTPPQLRDGGGTAARPTMAGWPAIPPPPSPSHPSLPAFPTPTGRSRQRRRLHPAARPGLHHRRP
jgi:hypothetical protein